MPFNKELWEYGRKIEDRALPIANKLFGANFKRNENDMFDILDFRDEDKKIIVEVKGRKIPSTEWEKTIITALKITEGYHEIEQGYRVHFIFVFTDKMFQYELKEDASFDCKYTGTNCIQHYLIPITELTEIMPEEEDHPEVQLSPLPEVD